MQRMGEKMDRYLDRLAEQIYKYFKRYGRKFLKQVFSPLFITPEKNTDSPFNKR